MCHQSCIDFGKTHLKEEYIRGKSVIEVGSCNVNGSLRPIAEAFKPGLYVGVDIHNGPGVDEACKAEKLIGRFGKDRFDLLICTEMLEHVLNWKKVMHNLKEVIKPEGMLLITTRSKGFGYHGYPYDFWRYELSDMKDIFNDFEIKVLENDTQVSGVFLLAKKPRDFQETKIEKHKLFSIILKKKSGIAWIYAYWPVWRFCKILKLDRCVYYALHIKEVPAAIRRKLSKNVN